MIQRNVSIKYNLPTKTVVKRFYKKFYIIASMNWKDGGALIARIKMFGHKEN